MRKAVMIVHQVREPFPTTIRVITQFEPLLHHLEPKPEQILAGLFLYTKNAVYQGKILKSDLNNQLAWSQNSFNTLTDSLSGRRPSIQIRFDISNCHMLLVCQIESGIRITLFDIVLEELEGLEPLNHMKEVFLGYRKMYLQQENRIKHQKDKIQTEMKEVQALSKQIEEQAQTEVQHMKSTFIDVVNQCKKQLRKHMKTGILELNEDEEEERNIKRRTFVSVNQEALESQIFRQEGKAMEIEEKNGFQDIFD